MSNPKIKRSVSLLDWRWGCKVSCCQHTMIRISWVDQHGFGVISLDPHAGLNRIFRADFSLSGEASYGNIVTYEPCIYFPGSETITTNTSHRYCIILLNAPPPDNHPFFLKHTYHSQTTHCNVKDNAPSISCLPGCWLTPENRQIQKALTLSDLFAKSWLKLFYLCSICPIWVWLSGQV